MTKFIYEKDLDKFGSYLVQGNNIACSGRLCFAYAETGVTVEIPPLGYTDPECNLVLMVPLALCKKCREELKRDDIISLSMVSEVTGLTNARGLVPPDFSRAKIVHPKLDDPEYIANVMVQPRR